MDVPQILQTVDDLVYQIVVLVVLIPKTLVRVIVDPTWAHRYVEGELPKEPAGRFDAYTPPVLLWALVGVVPYLYLIELLAGLPQSRVATETEWAAFAGADWEQRFLVVVSVALAVPLAFALRTLRASRTPVTRAALQGPFMTQCYVLTPAYLVLLPAIAATLRFDQAVPPGAWTNLTAASWILFWLWLFYAEIRVFRTGLGVSWLVAARRSVAAAVMALLIFFGLELTIITVFNGFQVWLTE